MKLQLKEDPREWRKQALLAAGGLAMANSTAIMAAMAM